MAGISDEDLQKIREANDIVSVFSDRVPLRQRGRDFWCCCPIHEEKSPSCKIDPASQLWHCFGCGAGGDVFSFIMKADDLSFPEAARKLAERANIHITEYSASPGFSQGSKMRLKEVCKETAAFYHLQLMRGRDASAAAARNYLGNRNMGGEIPKTWQLGFAAGNGTLVRHLKAKGFTNKELIDANVALQAQGSLRDRFYNRIMFPIKDVQGETIAFGGRILGDGQPKYLNSQETPIFHKSEVLYGLDKAKVSMASLGVAIVVEGYTDVISLSEAGISNVVATLGTALTKQHLRILSRHAKRRIVYVFDGDEAGQRAASRAMEFIDESITPEAGRSKTELAAVTLPDKLDPADFIAQQGVQALRDLIEKAVPLIAYGIERCLAAYDLSSAESRSRAANEALSILSPIKTSLLAKDYAVQIAGRTRIREEDALKRLSELLPPRSYTHDESTNETYHSENEPVHLTQGKSSSQLSQSELNRRRFEREYLSLCAQNPEIALSQAAVLAQTQWHEQIHTQLAENMLSSLAANPTIQAAELITHAQESIPRAADILTSGTMTETSNTQRLAQFLSEELEMGDLEDSIEALRLELDSPQDLSTEEQELLFASVVSMQKDLQVRRQKHTSIIE